MSDFYDYSNLTIEELHEKISDAQNKLLIAYRNEMSEGLIDNIHNILEILQEELIMKYALMNTKSINNNTINSDPEFNNTNTMDDKPKSNKIKKENKFINTLSKTYKNKP